MPEADAVVMPGRRGANLLPIGATYKAWEAFVEGYLPLVEAKPGFETLALELGYRFSEFNPQGHTDSWKAGVTWEPVPSLRFRYMEQQAVRVPNVSEIGSPITTGLENAGFDPCSNGNPNPPAPGSMLHTLCIQTGVPAGFVGLIDDIVSGQVDTFEGTDPNNLPGPETARTRTIGLVWQPDLGGMGLEPTTLSIDYYDIKIRNYIDSFSGQEALDACYVAADPASCANVRRDPGGSLVTSGFGLVTLLRNLDFYRASGVDFALNTGYDLGAAGSLSFAFNGNLYLKNELKSSDLSELVDCKGRFGTTCDPVPTWRHTVRT
ncbi:MAG: TonB-dependent receptor, partial [Rhodomicrobium sp.]|nr:TonB-dependent receptor [Rhodomicrobium sp.]